MTLPASGAIAFSDINTELGVSSTTQRSLNDTAVRTLFSQASGAVDMNTGHGKSSIVPGSQTFTSPGTYNWVAPAGITSVSIVAVGGGGGGGRGCGHGVVSAGGGGVLAYKNNISVTPGTTYSVAVGQAGLGRWAWACGYYSFNQQRSAGGNSCFNGVLIVGGGSSAQSYSVSGPYDGVGYGGQGRINGGGGAAGYGHAATFYCSYTHGYTDTSGFGACINSGSCGYSTSHPQSSKPGSCGGGGGGGSYRYAAGPNLYYSGGGGGGGVGISGQGSNGCAGNWITCGTSGYHLGTPGTGGSGGCSGTCGKSYFLACNGSPAYTRCQTGGAGGNYGGGGGSAVVGGCYASPQPRGGGGNGAGGAVRIIWPGNTRSFPSTNTGSP